MLRERVSCAVLATLAAEKLAVEYLTPGTEELDQTGTFSVLFAIANTPDDARIPPTIPVLSETSIDPVMS